ncbi:tyrosine-type recombinase/integrase [Microbacterium profundi]
MKEFPSLLQTFLIDYLPKRRGFSPHTLASYRDTFVLLLKWMHSHEGIVPDKVTMASLGPDRVGRFIRWLREERGCAASTSNARIAAIKSFAKFVQSDAPEHLETCRLLLKIPTAKTPKPTEVEFLSVSAVQLVVAAASNTLRELAIVSVLYDSGARVSEICSMTIGDLTLTRPHTARVIGKGRKARVIPLSAQVGEILARYITSERAHMGPAEPLFVNRSRTALGRAGVAYVLQKNVAAAHRTHPEEVPPRAHPHLMRHSKAMHLLEANVNLVYIRDFLGHESVTTTEIYARASTEAKRRAIEAGEARIIPDSPYSAEKRADLIGWLRHLL